jgi:membrane-bound metal-dependent hydrolase YbcI (DUF457 family)
MDPVSHAVLGRVVTRALSRDPAEPRGTAAAAILGALSPDVDFVLMPVGWDVYLRAHEIGSHSLLGAVLTGFGSACLVRLARRGTSLPVLARTAIIAACSHVLADIASGARLRPGWPLLDGLTSVPLVAMADPVPIVILLAGAIAMRVGRARRVRFARLTAAALAAFLALKGTLFAVALARAGTHADFSRGRDRVVEARWASLTGWHVYDRVHGAVRHWRIAVGASAPILVFTVAVEAESSLQRASRDLDAVRNFHAVHHLAFAVERAEADAGRSVFWSDIRFCVRPSRDAGVTCGLWVGGTWDADGRVLTQQVRVGSWIQNRRPPARAGSP